jgi:4-amino-4-deoxychorismate mutase
MPKSNPKDAKIVLAPYRRRIDAIDDRILELLRRRFAIIRQVGALKARHGFATVQTARVKEVIDRNARQAEEYGIPKKLIRDFYAAMIDEAHQIEAKFKKKGAR